MTSAAARPVARLSSPGEIVAAVPTVCGFTPSESVVVLSLRRDRRLGLTVRLDLPPPASEAAAAALLADRTAADGAARAVVVVFSAARRPLLVAALEAELADRDVALVEALHVRDGRWTSYRCTASCCPSEGTPVPPEPPLLASERVLDGRVVLDSREALVASLAPPVLLARAAAERALEQAWCELDGCAPEHSLALARACLDGVAEGEPLDVADAARLAVALHDVRVRDEVATWALRESPAVLALAAAVVRAVPPPDDAPACVLLAWVAYVRGDGALANVALDRALAADPAHALGLLLRRALDAALPAEVVRDVLQDTAALLRGDLSSPG